MNPCTRHTAPQLQARHPIPSRTRVGLLAVALAVAGLSTPAWAREGVEVGKKSVFAGLVPAEKLEAAADQQYLQLASDAQTKGELLPDNHPQVVRLRAIAKRIIPYSLEWNKRAAQWKWQVVVLQSKELNAFCMPGGKIAFYTGILDTLKMTDDEVAMVMGHEVAHALREHARERMGKSSATKIGAGLVSSLLGLGQVGDSLLNMGGQLLTLKFSREDESEADLVGMELGARAGYDPHAGITLWEKMSAANKGAPPQWLSTHPASTTRIKDMQASMGKVQPLYDRAPKPTQRWDQPRKTGAAPGDLPAWAQALSYWGTAPSVSTASAETGHAHTAD
jgi:predicted Zn-dependent protease